MSKFKKVLITGATGAIGGACVEYFHKNGYFVYINYNANKNQANKLNKMFKNSQILHFDVLDKMKVIDALEGIEFDVVVNNAGIMRDNLFFFMQDDDWDSVINTSLKGTYNVTKAILKNMMKNKKGSVVNVASISGLVGNEGQTNYSAAKGGVIAFTKAISAEVARYNIRVNAVAPGVIKSDMIKKLPIKEIEKKIPLKRIGEPIEVAECIFFLSDKASYITGETINISGGMIR